MDLSLEITRLSDDSNQTLGELKVVGHPFNCKTLELPYRDNKRRVSCIPCGVYNVVKRVSKKYGNHFHILNVENRDYILIHAANFVRQLLGCVAVGDSFKDIDNNGLKDVTNSKATLKKLLSIMPNEFKIEIK